MAPKRKLDDKKGMSTFYNIKSATNSQRGTQEPETPAAIDRGVLDAGLTFDNLYDALNCMHSNSSSTSKAPLTSSDDPAIDGEEDLDEYRRAWQLRRDLAELSRRPEGYFFTWRASDNRIYGAPLLTPPDLEAVQHIDGTWFRTRRLLDLTPHPYTEQWYAEYLHHFGLPTWFLRAGHLIMIDDDLESQRLGMMNAPSPQYATIPRSDYLDFRYSGTPHWPRQNRNGTYRLDIQSDGPRANLARNFPATSVTQFPYRTYVLPSGHIQLRSMAEDEPSNMPVRAENHVSWEQFEEGDVVPSSYHSDATGTHPASRTSASQDVLVQDAIDRHAVINPLEDVPGQGHLTFLSPRDEQNALARGYYTTVNGQDVADPRLVNLARIRGELAVGTGPNAGPIVVFWPNEALRNPPEHPVGPGAWRFLTSEGIHSNRGLAAINFGGSHGLPTYPTASQIRRLGQLFVDDGRDDLTDMIDIVWVPGEEDDEPGDDPVLDGTVETAEEEVCPTPAKKRRARRVSPSASSVSSPPERSAAGGTITSLHPNHDPTNNRGVPGTAHDQTGDPSRAEYKTAWAHGRWNTIDRSRVKVGKIDKHKFWCYSHRGWVKWKKWGDMDWDDPKWVSDLNKHREQTHQRAKYWQKRRPQPRQDYTDEENQYILELIKEAGGGRPATPLKEIAREFNERFNSSRNDTGIQSLIDRLRKVYKKHGGLPVKKGRGWKQQLTSREMRGAVGSMEPPMGDEGGEEGGEEGEEGEGEEGEEGEGGGESDAEGEDEGDGEVEIEGECESEGDEEDAEGEDDD